MARFGVEVANDGYRRFIIRGQQCYTGQAYTVEGDASSATYFWGLAALLGQSMCVAMYHRPPCRGICGFSTS